MDLDKLYKSKLDHSHGAGLDAVFAAGHAQGVTETKTKYERDFEDRQTAAAEGEPSDEQEEDATTGQPSKKGQDAKTSKNKDAAA